MPAVKAVLTACGSDAEGAADHASSREERRTRARLVPGQRGQGGGNRTLTAPTIIIDVGTRPAIPAIDGLDAIPYLTNASIMELADIPDHLLVLGGGYVGVEFAQMYRRFGSRVTLLQRDPQLLPREDPDIAEALTDVLRDEGIDIQLNAVTQAVERRGDGIRLTATASSRPTCSATAPTAAPTSASSPTPSTPTLSSAASGSPSTTRATPASTSASPPSP